MARLRMNSLAHQKRLLRDMVASMLADLPGCSKNERIKLYGCINDSQKTILDIKKLETSRAIDLRLKKLEKEKHAKAGPS